MVLDTGAGVHGLCQESALALHSPSRSKTELTGKGESRLAIALAKGVTFRLGLVELTDQTVAIVPARELETYAGRPVGASSASALSTVRRCNRLSREIALLLRNRPQNRP
jgi:hypothetical protein